MKTCHIFCAAEFEGLLERPAPGDWILAADGGLRHLQALALEPTGILGDFDSLGYTPQGPQVDRFPVEKDDTDSMLAVKAGLRAGFRRFLLYGALDGPRLDHTVANFSAPALSDGPGRPRLSGGQRLSGHRPGPGAPPVFSGGPRHSLCVLLRSGRCGVTLRGPAVPPGECPCSPPGSPGCEQPLFGLPGPGLPDARRLLLLWDRSNGLPERRITG